MKQVNYPTVTIEKNFHCHDCGWPVIFVCLNGPMSSYKDGSDWWQYCSNKTCKNHDGEGLWQDGLSWVVKNE